MTQPTIICPSCGTKIRLTDSLVAPLIEATQKQYEQKIAEKDAHFAQWEAAILQQKAEITKARQSIEEEVTTRLCVERERIAQEEAQKAKRKVESDLEQKTRELAELNDVLKARTEKLAEAQHAQAELIRKQRDLDDARRELDLTVEKKVQESLSIERGKARHEAEQALNLKLRERDEKITSMQRKIDELKQRSEQGSMQLQGEALELELENMLRERFPRDQIEPVPKGEFGGDVIQHVRGPAGKVCGTILWETKRTKNWSDGWLPKLRSDQRVAKANFAVLVSQALPDGFEAFDLLEGVWVVEPRLAVPISIALRQSLIALHVARLASIGQETKMEMVYQYLTGPRFKHRIEAIIEKFSDMKEDLDKERKAMTRLWAKREEQLDGVIESTAGMYGDLQGIAGRTLLEIEGLELPMLDEPKEPPL